MKTNRNWAEIVLFLAGIGLICGGIAVIYWPAAPIVAGVLIIFDLLTDRKV